MPYQRGEFVNSHLPAMLLLARLGWQMPPRAQVEEWREGSASEVLLKPVLREWLQKQTYNDGENDYRLDEANVDNVIRRLHEAAGDEDANKKIWQMLTLGTTVQQHVNGNPKSPHIYLIDWQHPEKNVYHLIPELAVKRAALHGDETRRPDVVLFVNGIPFVVIECKDSSVTEEEAVSQMIRNQQKGEIPALFAYAQILIAVNKNQMQYAVTGTPKKFWARWREENENDENHQEQRQALLQMPLADNAIKPVLDYFPHPSINLDFIQQAAAAPAQQTQLTEQDNTLISLCAPVQLLELVKEFILFDGVHKKIARWQQFFAVKNMLARIDKREENDKRKGGVIWHSQGSGKTITMILMARALTKQIKGEGARIILVSDRKDLDEQMKDNFQNAEVEIQQAKSGRHLVELIESKTHIITTLIHKFKRAKDYEGVRDESDSIFVLVDEGHRTQYGELHMMMRRVIPNACYLCFTGTPLSRDDKHNTGRVFGKLISAYTVKEAIEDGAVLPLMYIARRDNLHLVKSGLDEKFDNLTQAGNAELREGLKVKYTGKKIINASQQVIDERASDIHLHFLKNYKGTGLTAQLVASDKATAIKYHEALNDFNAMQPEAPQVTSEVVISAPSMHEGHEETTATEPNEAVKKFWKKMMETYGSEDVYNNDIINKYKSGEGADILIVVNKLLTGFDAPRNACLYLTQKLVGHTLLQAIARVNRTLDEEIAYKPHGLIVDYVGVLSQLNDALEEYSNYDEGDIQGIVTNVQQKINELPKLHSELKRLFDGVHPNEHELHLRNEEKRDEFYRLLTQYSQALKLAFSSFEFMESTSEADIKQYNNTLQNFIHLRKAVMLFDERAKQARHYEKMMTKLVNTHLHASSVRALQTEFVSIYNEEAFNKAVEQLKSKAAQAAAIHNQVKREINESLKNTDPAAFEKFSARLKKAMDDFVQERISDAQCLAEMKNIRKAVVSPADENLPAEIKNSESARAYYGVLAKDLLSFAADEAAATAAATAFALHAEQTLSDNRVVNLWFNHEAQNRIFNALEDFCYDTLKSEWGITLPDGKGEAMDKIIQQLIEIMRHRDSARR